jgi:hypothetical protein
MANVITTIQITHDSNTAIGSLAQKDTSDARGEARRLSKFFQRLATGLSNASIQVSADASASKASASLTAASVADLDTCVIASVTLTAKTSPASASQFLRGVSNIADGAALAACINAHPSLMGIVSASSANGVVTVSAFANGTIGNGIPLAGTAVRLVASSPFLIGGTGLTAAPTNYSLGL